MNTQIDKNEMPCKTPLEDLRQSALEHYAEASRAINHWSGFVEEAIKNYDPEKTQRNVIPYQCCPVCNGNGQTVADGFTSNVYQVCKVCNGARIIPMHLIIFPQQ